MRKNLKGLIEEEKNIINFDKLGRAEGGTEC